MMSFFIFSPKIFVSMKRPHIYLFLLLFCSIASAQRFKVTSGNVKAIKDVKRFNVEFEYNSNLKIRKKSEEEYLKKQAEKKELIEVGSGYKFIQLWYKNRVAHYAPTFIQKFNSFTLEGAEPITVAQNIDNSKYTLLVKTMKIKPGYDDIFYVEAAEIKFEILFFSSDNPEKVLCAMQTKVRGDALSDDLERIRTAYGNLGIALSKRLNRKALNKKNGNQ